MKDRELFIRQLKTIQNMLDTLLLLLMAEEDCKPTEDDTGKCKTCGTELASVSTMGGPDKWMCLKCG